MQNEFENENVLCVAKSSENEMYFNVKNECSDAYKSMLEFLIKQLKDGFSHKYCIELVANEKNYLPDLAKTDTNSFFTNCAKYTELTALMREYFHVALLEYSNYTDTYDAEEIVPCGGYAAFALGMASSDNFDIVSKFMAKHDSEHIISPRYFVYNFINFYGWSTKTVTVFCDCIYGANNVFEEAKNLSDEVLEGILAHVKEKNLKNYGIERLVNGIWNDFEEEQENASGKAIDIFNELANMMK